MPSVSKYDPSSISEEKNGNSKAINLTFFSLSSHNYTFRIKWIYVRVLPFSLDGKREFVSPWKKKKKDCSYWTLNSNKSFPEND